MYVYISELGTFAHDFDLLIFRSDRNSKLGSKLIEWIFSRMQDRNVLSEYSKISFRLIDHIKKTIYSTNSRVRDHFYCEN